MKRERLAALEGDAALMSTFLMSALGKIDDKTMRHSVNVAAIAEVVAGAMAPVELRQSIWLAGLLHDVGKMALSSRIFVHDGPLEQDEFAAVKAHTVIGERTLARMYDVPLVAQCALFHHERYDGKGYPHGIRNGEIPLPARIVAIADCYEAIRATRPYSRSRTHAEAVAEIARTTGRQFDPTLVDAFLKIEKRVEDAYARSSETELDWFQ